MAKQFSISEAKNRLPALVYIIEHGPAVQFTRHGKPVAVLVSISQYRRLRRLTSRQKSFRAALNAFRESIDKSTLLTSDDHFFDNRAESLGRPEQRECKNGL